ncbi:MAG: hypothetical protein QE271_00165 [Bacteriovoracaceae bacterium]|nr:hypothetical protein [Bacteriovoracaceae bacterium]
MDLKIPYKNFTDAASAYEKVQSVLKSQGLEGLPLKPNFKFDDQLKIVSAKGSGFQLKAEFREQDLVIELQLGLLFKSFKDKVLKTIESKLKNVV